MIFFQAHVSKNDVAEAAGEPVFFQSLSSSTPYTEE
jgi:hypothetical protein